MRPALVPFPLLSPPSAAHHFEQARRASAPNRAIGLLLLQRTSSGAVGGPSRNNLPRHIQIRAVVVPTSFLPSHAARGSSEHASAYILLVCVFLIRAHFFTYCGSRELIAAFHAPGSCPLPRHDLLLPRVRTHAAFTQPTQQPAATRLPDRV